MIIIIIIVIIISSSIIIIIIIIIIINLFQPVCFTEGMLEGQDSPVKKGIARIQELPSAC